VLIILHVINRSTGDELIVNKLVEHLLISPGRNISFINSKGRGHK